MSIVPLGIEATCTDIQLELLQKAASAKFLIC